MCAENFISAQLTATCNCSRVRQLFERYSRQHRAIEIDFRKETQRKIDRGRHNLHSYPAKLLAEIPQFFLSNTVFSTADDAVLDPFCGTGTVLLEAVRHGRSVVGADSNPLARLITRAKLSTLREEEVLKSLSRIKRHRRRLECTEFPDVVNIDYWFHPHIKKELARIAHCIHQMRPSRIKRFLQVCLSQCSRDLSKADPRLSVPVLLRKDQYPDGHPLAEKTKRRISKLKRIDVLETFCAIVRANLRFVSKPLPKCARRLRLFANALSIAKHVAPNSVQLVITSPPYLGAQKYIRASSIGLGWLRLCDADQLKKLDQKTVGREKFSKFDCMSLPSTGVAAADQRIAGTRKANPLRAKIANAYLSEMRAAIRQLQTILAPGGYLVLVLGNSHLCGQPFTTERYVRQIAEDEGLVTKLRLVDTIKSRGLMTKRNKTANVISREWIVVLQKELTEESC